MNELLHGLARVQVILPLPRQGATIVPNEIGFAILFSFTKPKNIMQRRSFFQVLMVLAGILIPASPVFANSLANWVLVWPGVVSIDPIFGLLPTVLVSFIERPFVSRSGVETLPLIRSIRANLLSFLAGIPVAGFVYSVDSWQGTVVLTIVAVAVSIAVEIAYLEFVLKDESQHLRWRWIILGNIVSNSVLIGIALTIMKFQQNYPAMGKAVERYQGIFFCAHLAISFSAVVAALVGPTIFVLWQRRGKGQGPLVAPDLHG